MLKLTETGNFTVAYVREVVYRPVGLFESTPAPVLDDEVPPDFFRPDGYAPEEWEALLDDMATWYFCVDHDFYHGHHYECTHNVETPEPRYDWKGEPR